MMLFTAPTAEPEWWVWQSLRAKDQDYRGSLAANFTTLKVSNPSSRYEVTPKKEGLTGAHVSVSLTSTKVW